MKTGFFYALVGVLLVIVAWAQSTTLELDLAMRQIEAAANTSTPFAVAPQSDGSSWLCVQSPWVIVGETLDTVRQKGALAWNTLQKGDSSWSSDLSIGQNTFCGIFFSVARYTYPEIGGSTLRLGQVMTGQNEGKMFAVILPIKVNVSSLQRYEGVQR